MLLQADRPTRQATIPATRLTAEAKRVRGGAEGLLLVDKPAGITSHDVVLLVRRIYGERSIGHLGTLDPFATGLLVLLLGRATRLATFIVTEPKVYEATIRLGVETDTDDCTGAVIREAEAPARAAIDRAIADLTGRISQVPPAYSAKCVDGTRAYDAARRGQPIDLEPVSVEVHEWRVLADRGRELDVRIECGTGTYVRALARDLGRQTGSAAHLSSLRRVRSGNFDIGQAATLDDLKRSPPPLRKLSVVASDE
ncbi:MAG: tRNA pseudouridine(55) synthase TruB [Gemmatimonadaceae bacterium]|nr:tRNA pseudouridine(55) synthase TruB [Gemmatimonadaceae bacterium]